MNLPFITESSSVEDTIAIAEEFSDLLREGDIVALEGNLGVGKTQFVKAVCNYFKAGDAVSPTFAIVNEYSGRMKIYHFDFYRISREEELFDIGFDEYLMDDEAVLFIEWSNLFQDLLPKKLYKIKFSMMLNEKRKIEIVKNG
ncbi:MAG: tRNA (adenosine(37)-N6)-threonylcarbamoyltransferase complex ATPase subunit type 1 TsaE [Melioribacteraceae bacterium]|nr:tRNA (adenosine(37)-N6)-threonylcarbamoyltransferase complex ATPase subunit type 1 TsaE [Melioribacteraceae bacterium]MCF8355381.1 tRNA (adenosine(37)-N6)-threonylcarbamoyltransferase complex ATPase subunit type 1 TsaE [Melioribacteraceae bacterium]MCF8394626.1 tRNA (adenosine(37)-N6)-threonylcarbamoyltransferase complex ATPase subunit type 1 TsaE [Melioribacteraceae bacterium]MCF8419623.1 tRNA (adenosine(37)-N6)-threonylcarbamoyltransferase complex ATPase subunit type 1 TsaE [Melioribacterac